MFVLGDQITTGSTCHITIQVKWIYFKNVNVSPKSLLQQSLSGVCLKSTYGKNENGIYSIPQTCT